ncbi:MAG TPA: hypothetical protein DCQ99_07820 [Nitrospinae bacterium]|nr:hypothetical protein [Nitrospinota bacterium]HBA26836.1 hypothetical protein [Nitrospinota bacterium]
MIRLILNTKKWKMLFLCLAAPLVFTACGGGGGGSTTPTTTTTSQKVSGVAAAGLPVVGLVYLKDSASTPTTKGPTEIGSDGSFSFDVTGLTAPFYLRAQGSVAGTSYDLYSATTSSGTVNINPLTNLAVAGAAGVTDPSSVYSNPAQNPITQANLDKAVTDIQTMLKPLLDAYNANVNPITGTYTADHTGLDAVFDAVAVNISTTDGSVTVVNNVTDATIASGTTTTLSTPTDTVTTTEVTQTQTTTTDIQAIQTMASNFATAINKGASLTAADLDTFYATTYGINDGLDRTQTITDQLSFFQGMTNTVTSMNITIEASGTDYKVNGLMYFSDGSSNFWQEGLIVTNEGGLWKLKGNGYKSDIYFDANTERRINADSTVQTENGLHFDITDVGNLGLQSVKITGSGLPASGITLSKPANEPVWLYIDTQYRNSTLNEPHLYVMDDTTIGSIPDNSIYTFTFYDANSTLIETRTRKIAKRPFMSSELTDGHFPTFGITSHSLSAANIGGTLTFTYAKPTAFVTAWMMAVLEFYNSSNNARYSKELLLNQSSGSILSGTPSWTATQGHFSIFARDEFSRMVRLFWMFQ